MPQNISVVEINYEDDVVTARQRARLVARLLSFDEQDQTRISTALSEIARFFVHSNKGGRIVFMIDTDGINVELVQTKVRGDGSPRK